MERDEAEHEVRDYVACFWCGRLHAGLFPLSVCPRCVARYSTMRSLEMHGSYPLDGKAIDNELTTISPGNYALGYLDGEDFTVFYVGRSDSDLRQRLHDWVGIPSRFRRYASAAKAPWGTRCLPRFPVDTPQLDRVGSAASPYTHFAYSYARSAEEAYAKEWRNYDFFGRSNGLDNDAEPFSAPSSGQPRMEGRCHPPPARWSASKALCSASSR